MNPYKQFVLDFAAQVAEGKKLPLGGFDAPPRPVPPQNAPNALFFAPHPDDECISGGLALRLLREAGMNVINVAVTLGSKKERQRERWEELTAACHYLGFGLESTGPNGLEKINSRARQENPAQWSAAVQVIERLLQMYHPRVVFFPHQLDWNSTHIGTYLLVTDALSRMPAGFGCYAVETEFWGQMQNPNAMVEMSVEDVAAMIAATSFHAGEVRRNPYHLLLPAWMMDNVRRGTELVGGQGGAAPDFSFAVLCRILKWRGGKLETFFEGGKQLSRGADLKALFQ